MRFDYEFHTGEDFEEILTRKLRAYKPRLLVIEAFGTDTVFPLPSKGPFFYEELT
jgi:hypothetical protein